MTVAEQISIEPLLITKLKIPRIHAEVLERQRLLDMLKKQQLHPLTVITASAGSGKTTLAHMWANQLNYPIAWYSIDAGDNDPKRFWTYFIAALQTVASESGISAQKALSSSAGHIETILTILINELAEQDKELTLVLDDYHEIELAEINEGMSFFIENMPPQLHLIISSRAEPDLPLARLRARRQLLEITAKDLRFTESEIHAFFNDLIGFELNAKQIQALENRTEGWIAGLQMAGLSMQHQDDLEAFITAFTGSHHHILDYLVEEVLDQQSDEVQQFLLQTSILDRLTANLCETVAQLPDAQGILTDLGQRNLFIVPLDDERKWYRYHQLFAEFLKNRLQEHHPELISTLHTRAALWFIKQDMIPEAVEQLINAERYEDTADLIEEHGVHIFWSNREWVSLRRWLDALPRNIVFKRPTLCAAYAWAYLLTGQPGEVAFYMEAAESALSPEDDNDTLGEVYALKAEYAMIQGDFVTALEFASDALDYLSDDNLILSSLVLQIKGYVYRNMGNVKEASLYLSEAHRTSLSAGKLMVSVFALTDLGDVKVLQGRLNEAKDVYQQIIDEGEDTYSSTPISAQMGLADIYREYNQLEKAIEMLHQGIELAEQYNIPSVIRNGNVLLSYALFAHGDVEEAMQACDFAVNSAERSGVERIVAQARAHQMNLSIKQNKLSRAEEWVASRQLSVDEDISYERELELVVFARLLIAQEKYESAIILLNRILANANADGRYGNMIEDTVLISLAYEKSGDTTNALTHLGQAIEFAVDENYIRVFVDGGLIIAKLLRLLATDSPHTNYLRQILDAFEATPPETVRIEGELIEDLSEREMDVLRLLAVGMSNRDIADQLIIGNSTVKTHTLNIYRKLNVNNRTHAVTRARSLSLI